MADHTRLLDETVQRTWTQIKQGRFWTYCLNNPIPADLYRIVMEQIYHYTRFNSINQAAAAFLAEPEKPGLLKFVYHHAEEELGHENMARHDIAAVGFDTDRIEPPLPPTRALIAYLNDVAIRRGPIARLGYSYWAESAYEHIDELTTKIRQDLGLTDKAMSFFVAHSRIDAKHAEEVREAIDRYAADEASMVAVREVAETTLYLTGEILNNAYDRFTAGESSTRDGHTAAAAG
ncbi:iron-containing redox enzyme family protein [Arhodomonas sp. AD133]|uniref:iron-containing redox enzyme family protein n=1 Tax=Arhodomonas sp. AD133 TaxID=3415009 RepID=UPI003EBFB1CE